MKSLNAQLLTVISFLFACQVLAKDPATAKPVTTEKVRVQTSTAAINEVGKLEPTYSADLTFSAGEKLKALHFQDGDMVKKGQLIAQLDDTQAVAELDKAKSSMGLAASKLNRVLALLKKQPNSMSAQDVEELKQKLNLAKADFRQKENLIQNYKIVAPFDGQLTNFTQSVGSRVEAATPLVSLVKLDPLQVHYSISQSEYGQAKLGQFVSITVDAYPHQSFAGKLDYLAPRVDESSGRVEVHAHIDNPDKRLVPGMFAKVLQKTGQARPEMVVSQTAISVDGNQKFVWLVKDNKVSQRSVKLGDNKNNGDVSIKSGLSPDDIIVVTGGQHLKDGDTVSIQNADDKEPKIALPETKPLPSARNIAPNKTGPQTKTKAKQETEAVEVHHEAA